MPLNGKLPVELVSNSSNLRVGELVRNPSRPDVGQGRLARLNADGTCDVVFDGHTFSGVSRANLVSVEGELIVAGLEQLLDQARFPEARTYYRDIASGELTEAQFERRLMLAQDLANRRSIEREEARQSAERDRLRNQVNASIDAGDFDAADRFHQEHCSEWWPQHEYRTWCDSAQVFHEFVKSYPDASLAELDNLFGQGLHAHVTAGEFARLKLRKLKIRMARLGMPLDEEQLLACASPDQHRLIRARAGSGKTRTLATLAALVLQDESLDPDQVLVLAFNKKAAGEIGDRIRDGVGIEHFNNSHTFHSLAYHLADHRGRKLVFDDGNLAPSRREQIGFVERILDSIMNPAFRELLYEFFRHELEEIDRLGSGLSGAEYALFRRSMQDYSLGGEQVKSKGEKFIADYLFEHDISYKYEKSYSWEGQDGAAGGPYRPDFSIMHHGADGTVNLLNRESEL